MPDKKWIQAKLLPALCIGLAFGVVGYCLGWLVGASQTPVVGTFIPLVVGLLGTVAIALLDRRTLAAKLMESIKKLQTLGQLPVGAAGTIQAELGDAGETSYWVPALWSLGLAVFCVASFIGTRQGIQSRTQYDLPTLAELLPVAHTPEEKPSYEEMAMLHTLRLHLASKRHPVADMKLIFADVIAPIFDRPAATKSSADPILTHTGPTDKMKPPTDAPGGPSPEIAPIAAKARAQEQITIEWLNSRPGILRAVIGRLMEEKFIAPAPAPTSPGPQHNMET